MTKTSFDTLDVPRFSRRWWGGAARTLLPVMLVTVLIWVYADLEFTDTEDFSAKLQLTTGRSNRLELLSANELVVTFTLRGNRSGLDAFRQKLADRDSLITFDVSAGRSAGDHGLSLVDILAGATDVDEAGLAVADASPEMINARLDRQLHVSVPVDFVHSNATLVEQPKLTMGILVAESRWKDILQAHPKPTLKTANVDLKDQPSGKQVPVEATVLAFIGDLPVRPDQETVTFNVEISQRTATRSIPVTVLVTTPPAWQETWRQYDLLRKDPLEWRPKITVGGAKQDLDQLQPDHVHAFVVLTEDDKKPVDSWLEREVEFRLPKGLDIRLIGEKPTVNFKLEKRPVSTGP